MLDFTPKISPILMWQNYMRSNAIVEKEKEQTLSIRFTQTQKSSYVIIFNLLEKAQYTKLWVIVVRAQCGLCSVVQLLVKQPLFSFY